MATQNNELFPNSYAETFQENSESKFEFLGIIVGKLIYEKLLTELPFSGIQIFKARINLQFLEFFLKQVFTYPKRLVSPSDLNFYDPEIFESMISMLKLTSQDVILLS